MEKEELWRAVLAQFELTVSRPNFLTWFQETGISKFEGGVVNVSVPNSFVREWLQNKYHKTILHSLRELNSDIKEVTYTIGKVDHSVHIQAPKDVPRKKRSDTNPLDGEEFSIKEFSVNPETNLNPRYTFETFVVGSFNELAHAAAQSIVRNTGTKYNPLFIHGGVGLGKTHLIQAVGNTFISQNPKGKVRYVSAEKYMSEIVDALRNQEMNQLKDRYRSVDLLIMDDIQFIARTEKMQEEFFHTFNALYEKNKQIIISSDRPPKAIAALEERLRSRFEGGMIADVGIPDLETRVTILNTKIEQKQIAISDDVVRFIAESVRNNIRELEGALNRIVMTTKITNTPLTVENARKILTTHSNAPKKFVSAKKIIKAVADFYDLTEKDLIAQSRKKDVVKPRQVAMYLMREELKNSYPSIGEKFSGRDHTTAIHSCEKIEKELLINPELEEEIKSIKEKVFSV